jgi:DNA phosphorothioation-dependent restriction protein DptG
MDDFEEQAIKMQESLKKLSEASEGLGRNRMRVEMFQYLQLLMHEKDVAGDENAVDVLNWAYDKLAEEMWFDTRLELGVDDDPER